MPVFSIPYVTSCILSKDAGRIEVYMHTSRLREEILAPGPDLVSTHRGKEVVIVFNKDTGEAVNMACNTEYDMFQPSKAVQITVPVSKSFPREIQRKI